MGQRCLFLLSFVFKSLQQTEIPKPAWGGHRWVHAGAVGAIEDVRAIIEGWPSPVTCGSGFSLVSLSSAADMGQGAEEEEEEGLPLGHGCTTDFILWGLSRLGTGRPPSLGTHQPSQQPGHGGSPACVRGGAHGGLHPGAPARPAGHRSVGSAGHGTWGALTSEWRCPLGPWGWAEQATGVGWGILFWERPNLSSLPIPGPTLLLNSDIIRARLGASALDRCVLVQEWGVRDGLECRVLSDAVSDLAVGWEHAPHLSV